MDIHRRFGNKVRRLRLLAGMTQEQLGEAVELSPVSISNIERGIHAPAFRKLEAFARALRVELDELFRFERD